MGIFSFFHRKRPSDEQPLSSVNGSAAWQENTFNAADAFREPLSPLTGMMPPSLTPPSLLERPQSVNQAEMQTVLAKLDVLAARLEQVNLRLEKIEQALRVQIPQQSPPPYQQMRRW